MGLLVIKQAEINYKSKLRSENITRENMEAVKGY